MSTRIEALVNPAMLAWARKSAHLDVTGAAKRLGVAPERLARWEAGESRPTINQAMQMAAVYRRPLSAFYLEEPPRDTSVRMTDFRRLPDADGELSPGLVFEQRRAVQRRALMLELAGDEGEGVFPYFGAVTLQDPPEQVAEKVRGWMGIDWPTQQKWAWPRDALNAWRAMVEAHNVLVFLSSSEGTDMEIEVARGFSIGERRFPVIVLNAHDALHGRIFTLMHEYAHLLLAAGGVCNLREYRGVHSPEQRAEVFCNHVAGAVLAPEWILRTHEVVAEHSGGPEWSDDEIHALSVDFSVSMEVIARRLLTLGLTTQRFYERKREEYREQWAEEQLKKKQEQGGFGIPRHWVVMNRNGKPFTRQVLSAYYEGHITLAGVVDVLGAKVTHIRKMESALNSPGD